MAVKKSELYSSLWSSCDELRGGMDASQYKDYVLVLLFVKYVSDRYAGQPFAPITIPDGASFHDMIALKGKSDIGDQINKKIIAPLWQANQLSDPPDFNDPSKLGSGKEMVERLTNLIAIFENAALDFSKNRAEGDDLLGDAYEYLMRHFATESGKSKGQFYTPAEVSRTIAQVLGVRRAEITNDTSVYDPTCGSGSLLLKIADEVVIARYFADEQSIINAKTAELDAVTAERDQLEEENSGEEGAFFGLDKINKASVAAALVEAQRDVKAELKVAEKPTPIADGEVSEADVLLQWLNLHNRESELKKKLKEAEEALAKRVLEKYGALTEDEIKTLVVDDKWLAALAAAVKGELDRVSQTLTGRIRQLAERYATPLPQLTDEVVTLAARVEGHLKKMGAVWK